MATEAALEGLFVGADHSIDVTVYKANGTDIQDITGWTIVLDIRKKDTSTAALLSKTGVVSGTYNISPGTNTQKVTFTLADDPDLAATVFTGDDWTGRYSIKRTDAGSEQPLRYGAVTITRVTQT